MEYSYKAKEMNWGRRVHSQITLIFNYFICVSPETAQTLDRVSLENQGVRHAAIPAEPPLLHDHEVTHS